MGASQKLSGSEFRRAFFVEAWEMSGFCSGLGASKVCRVGTSANCRGIRTVSARMSSSRDHESKLAGCSEKKVLGLPTGWASTLHKTKSNSNSNKNSNVRPVSCNLEGLRTYDVLHIGFLGNIRKALRTEQTSKKLYEGILQK